MVELIAHRGFAGIAPENTVGALRGAEGRGANAVELDVRPAADGTPVVFHDDRLEGDRPREGRPLTDARGLVSEASLETVRSATVLESEESVPTLAAVLDALGPITVNVELKSHGGDRLRPGESLPADAREDARRRWDPFVERVLADCTAFDGELLLSSFCEGALEAVSAAGEHATAALAGPDLEAAVAVARRHDCAAIHPPLAAVAGTPFAEEPPVDIVAVAAREGWAVNAWTATNWLQGSALAAAGVDGVIADYPGVLEP